MGGDEWDSCPLPARRRRAGACLKTFRTAQPHEVRLAVRKGFEPLVEVLAPTTV